MNPISKDFPVADDDLGAVSTALNINRQEIPIGTVVYFIEKQGHKWSVNFGTVEEHYTSEICVQLYELADTRYINGIPINDFKIPTRWQKLPKGWSYDTELFELTYGECPDELKTLKINSTEDILAAIKAGFLVKVQDIDRCTIGTEIDSKKGWRIVRKYPGYDSTYHPTHKSFTPYEIFRTYDEAQKVIDIHNAELERQANLTDLEWSIEQIDKDINRWASMYGISSDEKERFRERLMSIDNLEDVETRIFGGTVQWKYVNKKRWMQVEY